MKIHLFSVNVHLAGADTLNVHQIIDQMQQADGSTLNRIQGGTDSRFLQAA